MDGHISSPPPLARSSAETESTLAALGHRRIHIRPDTTITAEADDDEDDADDFYVANETRPRGQQGYGFVPPATTKSGRIVKPVLR